MKKKLLLGAVVYDAKVVPIWDIIRDYSNEYGVKMDYVLFSNYEAQVEALLNGMIDIAWNTNVAWIRMQHATNNKSRALVMRDTDSNFRSIFVSKASSKIDSLDALKGKKFGLGSLDSGQANILPYHYLQQEGIDVNKDIELVHFNSDVGKHGDTGRSEFDVLDAIINGDIDAGAIGSTTWIRLLEEGLYPEGELLSFYETPIYSHCNFTVMPDMPDETCEAFTQMLLSQDSNDPIIKKMMIMEGLNRWIRVSPKELQGYEALSTAMTNQDLLENQF